ncbi:MAG TPA: MFS transporter [Candidatus Angelobacter sp.]|nr:MFS transporter [Candidatus Angelobacter sp.]
MPSPQVSPLLYLGPFATMADRFAVAPLLIPIAVSLHVSLAVASGAASLYYLAYGLMPSLWGLLSDRIGRVQIMRLTLAGTAVADVLSAIAPNLTVLLVARFVTGGLACGVMPTTLVYIGDRFPFNVRQQAITRVLVFVALGTAAGTIGAGVAAHVLSWRVFFFIPAAVMAVLAVALKRVPESLRVRSSQNPLQQISSVLRNRWAVFLLALSILVGAVMFGFVTYLAPALEASGQSPAIAGIVVGSYGLSVLVCTRLFRLVAPKTTVPVILAGGAVMLALGFLIAAIDQNLVPILVASVLAGGAYVFMQSTFQTWATDVVPQARGTSAALFATAIFTGAAIATSAVAGLASGHQYSRLFLIAAVVTIPVLIGGTLGRWRYPGSEEVVEPHPEIS